MTYISFPEAFILLPLLSVIVLLITKNKNNDRLTFAIALTFSLMTLSIAIFSLFQAGGEKLNYFDITQFAWLRFMGANLVLVADSMAKILCLLTAIVYVFVVLISKTRQIHSLSVYFILLFLMQTGLMGVFLAYDGFLFYFFWELVLIPAYFLAIKWGTDKSLRYTFKFYIYTFLGSIIMLIGLIYLYNHSDGSFRWDKLFKDSILTGDQQLFFFICFFLAFAIKIPLVPFHTWQPETYKNAPIGVTIILSAVMVKMGVFAMMRWLIPFTKDIVNQYSFGLILFAIIGLLYASILVFRQTNLRKFVAYVSIAHMSLIVAALFAKNTTAYNGAIIQMFHHGINILGLWLIVDWLETRYKVEKISDIKAIASKHPFFAFVAFVIVLANIAVPLTNGFPGEFLLLLGIYSKHQYLALLSGLTVILGASYMLVMFCNIFFGKQEKGRNLVSKPLPHSIVYKVGFSILIIMIMVFGFYPQLFIDLSQQTSTSLLRLRQFF